MRNQDDSVVQSFLRLVFLFPVLFLHFNNVQAIGSNYISNRNQLFKNGLSNVTEYVFSQKERSLRESKLFPLFTIIRFTNEVCRTTSEEGGICYTKAQCAVTGGVASGTCAQGLGVCCRFVVGCGSIVVQNGTAFQSPNYPSKYTPSDGSNVCQVRIRRGLNVCQLRLNFIALEIDGPVQPGGMSTGTPTGSVPDVGTCKTDSLAVTGSAGTVPNLCGNLNGQHVYVDYGSSDTITLNLLLSGNVQRERVWNIEILMIPCNSLVRAPAGCLQYFLGISGQVQSFNYQGGTHLANMDYSICIRAEDSMRFIDWSPCSPGEMRISGGATGTTTAQQLCPAQSAGGGTSATAPTVVDYVTIMGGILYPWVSQQATTSVILQGSLTDRYCDVSFPASVTSAYVRSSVRPFILHFKTDNGEITQTSTTTTDASVGFCMKWQQNPQ